MRAAVGFSSPRSGPSFQSLSFRSSSSFSFSPLSSSHSLFHFRFSSSTMSSSTSTTPSSTTTIMTHDGTFHCDEALACFMLKQLPEYASAPIVRTRDAAILANASIVVDVGAVYDPATHRYDHHQRGFNQTLSPSHTMKLSSAGLIYKHFGRRVLSTLTSLPLSSLSLDLLYSKLYTNFIEAIDGIDNGINQYPVELQPIYKINTDLSARVGGLNPAWNEEGVDLDSRFTAAVAMTGKELTDAVLFYYKSWLPARQIVEQALAERFTVHPSGRIVRLPSYTIWKSHLLELEQEQKIAESENILYVLYTDSSKKWRTQCVPRDENSFESRKALPEPWRGIRDQELSKLIDVEGAIFVHAGGFIGGANTVEGVEKMAKLALEYPEPQKKQKIEQ